MNTSRWRRAEGILAVIVVVVGLAGRIVSRDVAFSGSERAFFGDVPGDYMWGRQLAFNPLGALLMLGAGLVALVAVVVGRRPIILGAATAAFALAAVNTVDLTQRDPSLGTRGGNVVLFLVLGIGLAAIELSQPPPESSSRSPKPS